MSLYKKWKEDIEAHSTNADEQSAYWQEFCAEEQKIYQDILANNQDVVESTIKELSEKYSIKDIWIMGFLDGISESIKTPLADLETLEEESTIKLEIDFEKLYWNMLSVPAEWLYTLTEWDNVLSEEKRKEITKNYKRSKTIVNENKIGRNDPCPCGSGKKYKKCCGR
ncbi:MAG: SEC-C metal-binding domain-containing protein [Eubacterium sp.]